MVVLRKNGSSEFTEFQNKETVLPPSLLLDFQAALNYLIFSLILVRGHNNMSALFDYAAR
jgi:hypothetical protein